MIRALVGLGVRNPVLLELVFIGSLLLGAYAAWRLPKEEFPTIDTEQIAVVIAWPGATPEDIEELAVRPIEDALGEVDDVAHVFVAASENVASIRVELTRGADATQARQQIERAVANADDLPDEVQSARVFKVEREIPVAHVGLIGDPTARELAEELAEELAALPGARDVEIRGVAERRIRVELDPAAALARGLDPVRVARLIEAAAVGAPAGRIERGDRRVVVRTPRGLQDLDALAAMPLAVGPGVSVRLGEVARIAEDWEPADVRRRVDGRPAIDLVVGLDAGGDALAVEPRVRRWAQERASTLPPGLDLVVFDDGARIVRDRLIIVGTNGIAGAALVALCLIIFIGWRNALVVVWGLPVAYAGAILAMWLTGETVNVISTFALLLVTGIIVDDAIIITENVQRHLEMGKARVQAAIDGSAEVFPAVFAATLTTCLAFAPLAMLDGVVGRIMAIVPSVVIFSLVASLFEAFVVLPGHLSHYAAEGAKVQENRASRALKALWEPVVRRLVRPVPRLLALAGVLVVLAGGAGLAATMRVTLQTEGNPYFVLVNLDLSPSASPDETERAVARVERFVAERAPDLVAWMAADIGRQSNEAAFPSIGPNLAQLKVGFRNDEATFERVPALLEELRGFLKEDTALVAHALRVLQGGPPAGADIDVRVRSRDRAALGPAVASLAAHLAERPGVRGIRIGAEDGAETFEVRPDPDRARRRGLSAAEVSAAARAALEGLTAVDLSLEERRTEVRVAWRGLRTDADSIGDIPLIAPDGTVLRLSDVATVHRARGRQLLERVDGRPAVHLTAEVDPSVSTPERERVALDGALAQARELRADLDLFVGGALADSTRSFAELPWAFAIAVLSIYMVLAVQFRSYLQPVVILTAVPLGLAGMVFGLWAFGMDLSFIALIGGVGLVGIVVNDSLVLVDFINRARRERGLSAEQAAVDASLLRLRPIVVTTVTTVLGLLPLALGIAGKEPLLAPMAVAIACGLAVATALTLVTIPLVYLLVEDVARAGRWVRARVVGPVR